MKKAKFILYLFIMFFAIGKGVAQVSSENLKAIPRIIQSKNNTGKSFEAYKAFNSSSTKSSSAEVEEVLMKASILSLDKDGLRDILSNKPDRMRIVIPNAHGDDYNLQLVRADIFTNDFTVKTNRQNKGAIQASGVHYRGIITDNYKSLVAMSFFEDEIMGFINSNNEQLVLGSLGKSGKDHILYHENDLRISSTFECHTSAAGPTYSATDLEPPVGGSTDHCVKIYVEVDYDIFLDKGAGTAEYIEGLFNQSATIYANDGVVMLMSEMFIWESASPYGGSCTNAILESFQAFRTSFNGDLGHLVSYLGGGGIAAGFNGLCNPDRAESMCYSGIQNSYDNVPTYSWSVMVFTHEMGHLLGSRHTHACVWNGNNTAIDGCGSCQEEPNPPPSPPGCASSGLDCNFCAAPPIPPSGGTIMSYCHLQSVGINFNNGFGPQPTNVILNNVERADCLFCDDDCVADLTLSGTITEGIYQAENTITSTATIGANQSVTYQAGGYILLEEMFLADAANGSVFLAQIEDCGSNFTDSPVNDLVQDSNNEVIEQTGVVASFSVRNFPNPFTGETTIEFVLEEDAAVTLIVSDATGKQLTSLLNQQKIKGTHQIIFDGKAYPAGMYYYTIQIGNHVETNKMILMK